MDKYKIFQIIIYGFIIFKESISNPLQIEKTCLPYLQAQYEQFPYIVFIRSFSKKKILCQGTLIDINWVLTSTNCINYSNDIKFILDDIYLTFENEIIRKLEKIEVEKNNNVSLIKMDKPIFTINEVTPIKLATENLSKNMKCIISNFHQHSNNTLTFIYWNIVNISKHTSNKSKWYLEDTICTKLTHIVTEDASPLICNNRLYGINSTNKPKIFNSIFNYIKWIQNTTNPITLTGISGNSNNYSTLLDTKKIIDPKYAITIDVEKKESNDLTSLNNYVTADPKYVTEDVQTTESDDFTSLDSEDSTKDFTLLNIKKAVDKRIISLENIEKTVSPYFSSSNIELEKKQTAIPLLMVSNHNSKIQKFDQPSIITARDIEDNMYEIDENYESEDGQFSRQTNSDKTTTQYVTVEKLTISDQPSTTTIRKTEDPHEVNEMYETEGDQDDGGFEYTEQSNSGTTPSQYSANEIFTTNSPASTRTKTFTTRETEQLYEAYETRETEDDQFTNPTSPDTSPTQYSTTELRTTSPQTSSVSTMETEDHTEKDDIYETEDSRFSEPTDPDAPPTQHFPTTEESTTSFQTSTIDPNETEDPHETNDAYETEDTEQTDRDTPTTPQPSTTEKSLSSTKPLTTTDETTDETFETEDGQVSEKTSTDITVTDDTENEYETEDLTPVDFDTPPMTIATTTVNTDSTISTTAKTTTVNTDPTISTTTTVTTDSIASSTETAVPITPITSSATTIQSPTEPASTVTGTRSDHTTANTKQPQESSTFSSDTSSSDRIFNTYFITFVCCLVCFMNI